MPRSQYQSLLFKKSCASSRRSSFMPGSRMIESKLRFARLETVRQLLELRVFVRSRFQAIIMEHQPIRSVDSHVVLLGLDVRLASFLK